MIVRSQLLTDLGVVHGFSTRVGGVSEGRYATLNVGGKWGDAAENVAENRRRLAAAGGFALDQLRTVRQIHGARVVIAQGAVTGEEADALAASASAVLGVYTADCVPLLLADGQGRAAAVHAGWRGTVAEIAARAVEALRDLGAAPSSLVAALGPHICPECFEVGEEVAAQFESLGAVLRSSRQSDVNRAPLRGRPHVDLYAANRAILERAGVTRIDARPPCTLHEPERFFSFRRDGAGIGQMLSFVVAGVS